VQAAAGFVAAVCFAMLSSLKAYDQDQNVDPNAPVAIQAQFTETLNGTFPTKRFGRVIFFAICAGPMASATRPGPRRVQGGTVGRSER